MTFLIVGVAIARSLRWSSYHLLLGFTYLGGITLLQAGGLEYWLSFVLLCPAVLAAGRYRKQICEFLKDD